jgi:nitrogen fixation protein FixH
VSFFDFLRTGYPVLDVSGAGTSGVSVPRRFMYPNGESIDNSVNLSDAIKRQFSSGDKIDEGTWLYQ